MAKLYELSNEWNRVYEMADDPEMDEESWFGMMELIEGDIKDKVEGSCQVIKELDGDVDALAKEIARLQARKQSAENRMKWLKTYIQRSMEDMHIDKIEAGTFKVGIQGNTPSVVIPDESLVPEEFLVPQPAKIDKKAIGSFLKDLEAKNETCEWAHREQSRSIRIR